MGYIANGEELTSTETDLVASLSSLAVSSATQAIQKTSSTTFANIEIETASGTVSSVSVTTANGVSGSVATATTTPAITLTLGAITPTSVAINGGTALTTSNQTGTGSIVLATSPTLVTPVLGTPTSGTLTNCTGLPLATGVTGILTGTNGGTGVNNGTKTFTYLKNISITAADDTGVYTLPTGTKTLLATDGAGTSLTGIPYTLTGTANQVVLSAGTGNITFSLPQSIATSSAVSFASVATSAASPLLLTNGQLVTVALTSQTVGGTTLTIPNFANVSDTFVFITLAQTLSNKTFVAPVLGTPTSGTLTNCTGLPVAGIAASTSTALGVGSIELGHATDTTLSRSAAGVLAVEGVVIPSISSTNTLSNKRRTPRVYTATNNTSLTPEIDTYDVFHLTAMSGATTINNHSTSTPVDGELMEIRFLDNGTARALTWGNAYVAKAGVALPTTTTLSKNLACLFEWNANLAKWNLMASGLES